MAEPRILLYDIETAPILAYVWRLWNVDHVLATAEDWYALSIAWKWLGEREVHVLGLDDVERTHPEDDFMLAVKFQELFNEADVVISHNGVQFDQPKARTRMIVHHLTVPSPFKEIDTLQVARRQFAFSSNKLDDLCQQLGIGKKAKHNGFATWQGCLNDDPKAWATMKRYNKSDVRLLEKLYLRLRPWMPRHPNLALLSERPETCPRCQAAGSLQRRGWSPRGVTRVPRFQCQSCGGWSQGRQVDKLRPDTQAG